MTIFVKLGPLWTENMSVFEGREWTIRTCFMHIQTCHFRRSRMADSHLFFSEKNRSRMCDRHRSADPPWGGPSLPAGPWWLPEPNVCQAPSLERLRKLSQKGCVHKSSGSALILHRKCWTKQWLSIWLSFGKLLGRGPHKNCKNDLDDQTWRELE